MDQKFIALSVAKCLKLKNRLVGRLSKTQEDIQLYNSVLKEQENKVDIPLLTRQRDEIAECLVLLKTKIMRANQEIQEDLIRIGELKAKASWVKEIPVRDGKERHGYQNTEIEWVAVMKKKDIDEESKRLEVSIDRLQDKVDEFNHATKIEIDQRTLDLAS